MTFAYYVCQICRMKEQVFSSMHIIYNCSQSLFQGSVIPLSKNCRENLLVLRSKILYLLTFAFFATFAAEPFGHFAPAEEVVLYT